MHRIALFLAIAFAPLSLWAEVLTATVTRYDQVELSGTDAESVIVSYEQIQNQHFRGRLLSGEQAILTISGLPAGRLDSIVLTMHSNNKAGAGSLLLTVNDEPVWTIADSPFSSDDWAGSYTSEWVPIRYVCPNNCATGDIALAIESSTNSLYINEFSFYYTPDIPMPHTVSFCTQTDAVVPPLSEQGVNTGIVLPDFVSPDPEWTFLGWMTDPLTRIQTHAPEYYKPGRTYFPATDCTLYALYCDRTADTGIPQATEFRSGTYSIVSPQLSLDVASLFAGAVADAAVPLEPCRIEADDEGLYTLQASALPTEVRYGIVFDDDSLQITHVASNSIIGFRHTKTTHRLSNEDVWWHWLPAADHSLYIYTLPEQSGSTLTAWIMYDQYNAEVQSFTHSALQRLNYSDTYTYLLLFPAEDVPTQTPVTHYSSAPGEPQSVPAALHNKEIRWDEPVSVYSPDGRLLFSGVCNRSSLPAGPLIIRQREGVFRLIRTR